MVSRDCVCVRRESARGVSFGLGMAIIPPNPQIRLNPPVKTHPLYVILSVAGEFSIIN